MMMRRKAGLLKEVTSEKTPGNIGSEHEVWRKSVPRRNSKCKDPVAYVLNCRWKLPESQQRPHLGIPEIPLICHSGSLLL